MKFKIYGEERFFDYFQVAKFHLGGKVFSISYSTWLNSNKYRLGIVDERLYSDIIRSDKFSNFVWQVNWRLER